MENVNITEKSQFFIDENEKNWLKSLLKEGIVQIVFEKADGTLREMNCTLAESVIPSEKAPKNSGKAKNDNVLAVFDVDKSEWRSFRYDSVKELNFSMQS
jgi:hypothetical protein